MAVAASTVARTYRSYRAPRANGAALVEPHFSAVSDLLSGNRQVGCAVFTGYVADCFVLSRAELTKQARTELIRLASEYTSSYRPVGVAAAEDHETIIMSGHQPTLFHPGVWFKNFALSGLAKTHNAQAIHLIVDNDTVAAPSIETPAQDGDSIVRQSVVLDDARATRPYEEWQIVNRARFDQAAAEATKNVEPFVSEPLIESLWPLAKAAADRHGNLGLALSQARHQVEADLGLSTLELPVSQMADTDSFRQFCAAVLLNADQFRTVYNDEVLKFRRVHKIRSQSHPVPLLRAQDDWIETAYWTWTSKSPLREPLYVRTVGDKLELRAGLHGEVHRGPASPCELPKWLNELRTADFKIRPRALSMTMYVRLILCDLFLHGIGGAKYDELCDSILGSFFGVTPPRYLTLSATLLLPLGAACADQDDIRQIDGCLRDLWFHPEAHVDIENAECRAELEKLAKKKRALAVSPPPRGNRKNWHEEIARINDLLRAHLLETRRILLEERAALISELRNESILRSREFSFSLFPKTRIKPVLLDLSCPSR